MLLTKRVLAIIEEVDREQRQETSRQNVPIRKATLMRRKKSSGLVL